MNLFDYDPTQNILPEDGEANYFGSIIPHQQAQQYQRQLLNTVKWENDQVVIYGKHITTKRKVAWYGDSNYAYTYSNITKHALPWTEELATLKHIVEESTKTTFNSCLLNLYHNGDEGVSWHSDDEKELGARPIIASLSLGAERKFSLKNKDTKEVISLTLETGSLFVMKGTTQANWIHCLPKMKNITTPRINLTFRKFR